MTEYKYAVYVLVMLSYGDCEQVLGTNGVPITTQLIIDCLEQSEALKHIPKVVILQVRSYINHCIYSA